MPKQCLVCEFNNFQTLVSESKVWRKARYYLNLSYAKQAKIETLHRISSINCCSELCTEQAKNMRSTYKALKNGELAVLTQAVKSRRDLMIRARTRYETILKYKNPSPAHIERAKLEFSHAKSLHSHSLRQLNHFVRNL